MKRRSIFLAGLGMVLRSPGAVLWTYGFNLLCALVFSMSLHARLASVLNHSLAAEGLNSAFDLGTLGAALERLGYRAPSAGAAGYVGLPLYFAIYFVLVPGALFCYRAGAPGKLSNLLSGGLRFFWRFVRITLLTAIVSGIVLGPLLAAQAAWADHVQEQVVGVAAVWQQLPGWLVILAVAGLLRLYFDLVEVYTVQLDDLSLARGKADRRVRKVLLPAWKTLWRNLPRAYGVFLLLTVAGLAAWLLGARAVVLMLAQPRVWPAFVVMQLGVLVSILMRYWQRGAETVLAADLALPGIDPVPGAFDAHAFGAPVPAGTAVAEAAEVKQEAAGPVGEPGRPEGLE